MLGTIEAVPQADAAVDVVVFNCVVNPSSDEPKVFAEMHRLLRPGGRIGVKRRRGRGRPERCWAVERESYVGCIAGALSTSEYLEASSRPGS